MAREYSSCYKLDEYSQVNWVPRPFLELAIILAQANAYLHANATLRLSGTYHIQTHKQLCNVS